MNENKSGKTLRVDDVTFRYGNSEQPIIDGFSAVFPYGKITALTGENGCGKTTLARIIMGILKPENGTVMLGDDDLCGYSLAQTGRRIGYVMQDPSRQIFSTSVDEEVRYGLKNMVAAGLITDDEADKRVKKYLGIFELDGRQEEFPLSLSQGEKQRLIFAAILAMEPEFLILDEPTAAIDDERKQKLSQHLKDIVKNNGCGVIIITHDHAFAEDTADEEIRMSRGRSHV